MPRDATSKRLIEATTRRRVADERHVEHVHQDAQKNGGQDRSEDRERDHLAQDDLEGTDGRDSKDVEHAGPTLPDQRERRERHGQVLQDQGEDRRAEVSKSGRVALAPGSWGPPWWGRQ